jgi:outer membrane protein with beta-barrel domain
MIPSRNSLSLAFVLLAALVVAPATAHASGYIAPFIGLSGVGQTTTCIGVNGCERRSVNWGGSIGTTHGLFGAEEDVSYIPQFFVDGPQSQAAILTIMSNFLVQVPTGKARPYALFGLGVIRPHATLDLAGFAGSQNTFGYDVGGGVLLQVQRAIGIRSDVRRFRTINGLHLGTGDDGEQIDFWRGTVGFVLSF